MPALGAAEWKMKQNEPTTPANQWQSPTWPSLPAEHVVTGKDFDLHAGSMQGKGGQTCVNIAHVIGWLFLHAHA